MTRVLAAAGSLTGVALTYFFVFDSAQNNLGHKKLPTIPPVPDVIKSECQELVEGQLAFRPIATMRQGKEEMSSAEISLICLDQIRAS